MELSEYTFRLMLLFLPGIIAFIIIDNLTIHKETKLHHWVIYSFLLGFASYFPWTLLCEVHAVVYGGNSFSKFLSLLVNYDATINFYEVFIATMFSVVLGLCITKIINRRLLFKAASVLRVSDKFPEVDAWVNCLACYNPVWVRVRDIEHNRIYQGRLASTSDPTERDGIVLEETVIYNEQGVKLYQVPVVYIPKKMEDVIIEFI